MTDLGELLERLRIGRVADVGAHLPVTVSPDRRATEADRLLVRAGEEQLRAA